VIILTVQCKRRHRLHRTFFCYLAQGVDIHLMEMMNGAR
jgi:hypothetical protein